MYIIITFGILILSFFIYQGFCTRCPNCAYWGQNKQLKNNLNKAEKKILKEFNEMNREFKLNSFASKKLICRICKEEFSRNQAMVWLKISKQLNEEEAIKIYREARDDK